MICHDTVWHLEVKICFHHNNLYASGSVDHLFKKSIPCRCRQEKVTTAWRLGTGGTSRAMAELKWSMDVCAKRISFGKVFGTFWYTVTWVSWWCILSSYSNSSSAVNCKSPLDLGGNSKIDSSFKAACREGNEDGGTREREWDCWEKFLKMIDGKCLLHEIPSHNCDIPSEDIPWIHGSFLILFKRITTLKIFHGGHGSS